MARRRDAKLMPTYLYKCEKGHEYEVRQGIKDSPSKTCMWRVKRKGEEVYCEALVKRLINNEGGFVLKGGGWTPKTFQ